MGASVADRISIVGRILAQSERSGANADLPTSTPLAEDLQAPAPIAGRPAPDFALLDLAGHELHLRHFSGQVVVLNFWATW